MEAFTQHIGTAVPLRRSNVDTDQIIPAVYLKRVTRTGFEDGLFAAWRNDPSFVLNQPDVGRLRRCLELAFEYELEAVAPCIAAVEHETCRERRRRHRSEVKGTVTITRVLGLDSP